MNKQSCSRNYSSKPIKPLHLSVIAVAYWLFTTSLFAAPVFVQRNSADPQSSQATVAVSYTAAETAGDLNVVVVGWNDTTSTVQSVTDSLGNTYSLAIGPTSGTALRQSIYYAANVKAGANTVTVTFNQAAAFPDIRVLEYRGVNAVDVTMGGSGNSATSSSGAATTTIANDLIFGANMVATTTKAAGSGFTSRVITSPDGDIAEDKVVTTAGSNSATATLSSAGPWVMQMVAFGNVSGPLPTVTSVTPNNGPVAGGTAVTIGGTNFAAGATVTFGTAAATNVVVVNSTTITAKTPAGSAGAVMVTVSNPGGQSGGLANAFTYIAPPTVTSVTPSNGPVAGGTAVTIGGTNFTAGATVTFGTAAATNVVVVNSTTITATTPAGSVGAVTVTVTVNGQSGSLANGFTYVAPPTVTSVSPNSGTTTGGTAVTIGGTNFAAGATVTFGTAAATNVAVLNSTTITATTPAGSVGAVTVTVTNLGSQSGSLANGYTYVVVPTVTSVTPNSGPVAGGTAVTIGGANFAAGATVTFGTAVATNVAVLNGTTITATTPAGSVGAVTVTVTNPGSLSGSLANGYTYVAVPTVTSVTPNNGPIEGGTAVTIGGTNFAAGATVTFGTASATNVVVVNGTTITATTPAGSVGAVTVTITNPGSLSGSLANGYTYVVVPTVTSVAPNNGPIAGGTAVTIGGTNFAAGATVTFGTASATNVVVVDSTTITATTPAGSAGAVTVTVTVNGQSGSLANGFTYTGSVAISFVQRNSADPQSSQATVAVSYTAAETAGDLNVVVVGWNDTTSTVQSVTDSLGNTYSLAIGPTSGTALRQSIYYAANVKAGANTVTVTFNQAAAFPDIRVLEYRGVNAVDVTMGGSGNSATSSSGAATTTIANDLIFGANMVATTTKAAGSGFTSRVITSPDGDIAEDKVVTTAGSNSATATLSSAGPWVMQMVAFGNVSGPLPTVTSVTPNNGPVAGGTAVTIGGTNFAAGATVTFGTAAATNVVVVNSTTITAKTPAGSAGAVMVTVSNPGGQSGGLANAFTYIAPPTVTSVTPSNGPVAGGTAVTIGGTNFTAGATVTFGTAAATNVVVVNSTTITATTPAGSVGAVTVTVTVNGQSGSLANGFTYVAPPTVTSVSPNSGTTTGGTAVTIGGTNFAAGATVTFGTAAATNVAVLNSTTITATTPAGSVGAVTVTVTNLGSQSGSLANGYTYVVVPTVTSVTPNSGPVAGGTAVTIGGANFAAGATVTFGTAVATNVAVLNGTTITATTPAGSVGAVTVTVTVNGQSGSLANGFTYTGSGPTAPSSLTAGAGPGPVVAAVESYINSTFLTSHTTAPFDSTGGDSIVLLASSHAGVAFTPSDSFGNSWIPIGGPTNTVLGFDLRTELWFVKNPIVGSGHTVTMGLSAAQSLVMSIFVVTGSNISSPIDAISLIGSDNGTQTVNVVSPGITTSDTNDLLLGFVKVSAGAVFTSGPGFTPQPAASSNFLDAESGSATSPGNYSATFTLDSQQTWQSAVVAAANNPNQTGLSWIASTDTGGTISNYLVERCQGVNCANFAQIGTAPSPTTTFNDKGLVASTTYNYRVRAQDSKSILGPYSNVATLVTPATIPSLPGNLTATAISNTQANLSWTASTENGGTVSQYLVERCQATGCTSFSQVGTATGTAYTDAELNSGTSYTYRVRAADTAGNLSPYSNLISTTTQVSSSTIRYVQGSYLTPQSAQSTVSVQYSGAQAAGDLNVVVVGWNDSVATVSAVTDTSGNSYTLAVGPTVIGGLESQSIYYANNIAAGANMITVKFSTAASYPDIRILEYSGADQVNPVDVTSANSGNSSTSSSVVSTTNPSDLLFAANTVQGTTAGPGTGFTSRLLTAPDSDIAEDEMVSAPGSYTATAPTSPSSWIMQVVAFRAPSGPPAPSVSLSSTSVNFGSVLTGSTTSPQPVTLANIGTAPLLINSISIAGGNASDFAQTNNCVSPLLPNTTCTINLTFTPSNSGSRSSTLQISDNAPGTPQTISLSGTGTGLSVTPRASVVTFIQTQQFTANSGVTWSVDGLVGGSPSSGTISGTGLYTPPQAVGVHTVTGTTTQGQAANATVYISNYAGTFTYHNDNLRTGQNNSETVLTPANVNPTQFGKLFSYSIDGIAFASPLYMAGVNIPGNGVHNVVYVATEHDSLYAFDADGLTANPLWHVSFLNSGVTTVPCANVGECGDIPVEIGITSTPVIDPASSTIYIVAKTKEGSSYVQRLHALDITTGAEKFGGPVSIAASVPGTGSGSVGGRVAFDPLRENQRPGLLLSNGVIYMAFGSHGDQSPWHGWVLGYNATTLQQVLAYNATPNGSGGGIWQSGGGLATDATGSIYFTTSNGDFDVDTGGVDYGDTIEKLSTSGSVIDYFTPHDQLNMSVNNLDFGSAGPVLLVDQASGPYPHLLISAGKGGTIYVVNRDNMGHYNPNNDNQIVQALVGGLPNGGPEVGNFSAPVYFNGYVYFAAVNDSVRTYQLANGLLSTTPTSMSAGIYPIRGGALAASSNGSTNGILWVIQANGADPGNVNAPGALFAYDATNLSDELYDSNESGSRDALDLAAKFSIPLVANGKVFIGSQSRLTVYGLLP
jgi:IPT/TIG domain/Fibronectin type III domain/Abnormal spindle-like microcephaly-assoc'd, ASPM-SPD-2-Hydin